MRMRAARWSVALTLVVGAATLGVAVPQSALRAVLRDVTRIAATPVHAATAAGLPGPDAAARAHARSLPADAVAAPAALLAVGAAVLLAAAGARRRRTAPVRARAGSRAPPRRS